MLSNFSLFAVSLVLFRSMPLRSYLLGALSRRAFCTSDTLMNRLANEKSPYILQHKDNPVNWYPWNEEAFQQARELNRPIFLSVGYSTCHWCHVMEKESFENDEVAKILNDNFVSIKVDREERPDVDKLYMSFILALTGGGGGWPMSVFLTPSLAPITGGTYFPREDSWNRKGFKSILRLIAEKWAEDPEHITNSAKEILESLAKKSSPGDPPSPSVASRAAYERLRGTFDAERGGFGDAPKFPKPVDLSFLLSFAVSHPSADEGREALKMVQRTLHAIYHGGIHDHVGKGFHRYSVDGGWHVPHFEKMAYDQGQLLSVFSNLAILTGDEVCREAARDIVEYVGESLSQKDGGFWAAEDADSYPEAGAERKKEGAFCVWTKREIEEVLEGQEIDGKPLADIVCAYYGVEDEGNAPPYTDPHDELKGQNVLIMHSSHGEMCEILGMERERLKEAIGKAKGLLRVRRASRPRPHLDSKMVTAWQGLLISGYARAALALDDAQLAERAQTAVAFVRANLVDDNGDLVRAVYTGQDGSVEKGSRIAAFSDDYAFLIQGLLDLYEATLDETLIEWAEALQKKMDAKFWEGVNGYFISEAGVDSANGVRIVEDQDGAEPSASSVAVCNLARLADYLDSDELRAQARRVIAGASARLARYPFILCRMLEGYSRLESGGTQVVIVAETEEDLAPLLKVVHRFLIPGVSIVRLKPSQTSWLSKRAPHLQDYAGSTSPTVFVCQDKACGMPVNVAAELEESLKSLTKAEDLKRE